MNLYQLDYFREIADAKSISAAALKLRISQSALSQSLKLLEDSLGQLLFERRARKLYITEAGAILYRHVKGITRQLHDTQHELEDLKTGTRGTIYWGAPEFLSAYYLQSVMKEISRKMPQVQHVFRTAHSEMLREWVVKEELTFAIIAGPSLKYVDLDYHPLLSERFPLYLASRHALYKERRKLRQDDLLDVPLLRSYQPRHEGLAAVDQSMARAKFHPRHIFQIESFELRRQMLLAGLGMGFFPQKIFATEEASGKVRPLHLFDPVDLQYALIYRKNKYLPRASRQVMDLIQTALQGKRT